MKIEITLSKEDFVYILNNLYKEKIEWIPSTWTEPFSIPNYSTCVCSTKCSESGSSC